MLEPTLLEGLQTSLDADGYRLEAWEEGDRIGVRVSATPDACEDCLVPKDVMRGILGQVLGVSENVIDLFYPAEST